ncbi:MAG: hypothetical protein V4574_03430 [Pseudomonadota bacterium]
MSAAILRSSLTTSLARYSRSWGLWVLLLIAPVAARFWINTGDDPNAVIAVHDMAPVLTSAVLGVSLGVVVSTLLLPIAFIYLRSNATRLQPWQVEEVTAGSRIAVALGRFGADVAVLAGVLAAMNLAGWLIGWLVLPGHHVNYGQISMTLWLIAGPALMGVAAVRILFDALGFTRGWLGEVFFYILWMASLIAPIAAGTKSADFARNLTDFPGFIQPLTYTLAEGDTQIAIGSSVVGDKKIALDVMAGIESPGYIASRFAWAGIAVLIAILAGLLYAPHKPRVRKIRWKWLRRLLSPGAPRAANPNAPPARGSWLPAAGVLVSEMRLIGQGRLWLLLAAGAAASGLFADFRTVTSPAALLLLAFGLSAHAARSERSKLLALTATAPFAPMARRAAFVVAGIAWTLLIGAPAIVRAALAGNFVPLELSLATGAAASVIAILLGAMARSAFAPRLVLLILWYGYLSAA